MKNCTKCGALFGVSQVQLPHPDALVREAPIVDVTPEGATLCHGCEPPDVGDELAREVALDGEERARASAGRRRIA